MFCGDETAPGKKESPGTSKDTVHLKWCTPKTTSAPGMYPLPAMSIPNCLPCPFPTSCPVHATPPLPD